MPLSARAKDGKRQDKNDNLRSAVQCRADEIVVLVVYPRQPSAKPQLRQDANGNGRPNPGRVAVIHLSSIRRHNRRVDRPRPNPRPRPAQRPMQNRQRRPDKQAQGDEHVAAAGAVHLPGERPRNGLRVEALVRRSAPDIGPRRVEESTALVGDDCRHDGIVESRAEQRAVDLGAEHDAVRDLGVLPDLEPVGQVDSQQNHLVRPARKVEVGQRPARVHGAGDHFGKLVGADAGAVEAVQEAGEGGDACSHEERDHVSPCRQRGFSLDVDHQPGDKTEHEKRRVPPHGDLAVPEHGLVVRIRLGPGARLLPRESHVLAVEDQDVGDEGANRQVCREITPDRGGSHIGKAHGVKLVLVNGPLPVEDGSRVESRAVAVEKRRRHKREAFGAPGVVVIEPQHRRVPYPVANPRIQLLLQRQGQEPALDVLPVEGKVEQAKPLVGRRAAKDGGEDAAGCGGRTHRRQAEDGDAAKPRHHVAGKHLPRGGHGQRPAKLDQAGAVLALVKVEVLVEHDLRQRRPVHHLGGIDDERPQHAGQDEAAQRDGKGAQDGCRRGHGPVVKQSFHGVYLDAGKAVVPRGRNQGRHDVFLDAEWLAGVEESKDTAEPWPFHSVRGWCCQRPRLAGNVDQNWRVVPSFSDSRRINAEGTDLRCIKTADTCICVGLNVYSMVMTLDSAVKAVPRTMDRKVSAASPSSRSETRNRDTSAPTGGFVRKPRQVCMTMNSLCLPLRMTGCPLT